MYSCNDIPAGSEAFFPLKKGCADIMIAGGLFLPGQYLLARTARRELCTSRVIHHIGRIFIFLDILLCVAIITARIGSAAFSGTF